ncbi:MAG TPA: hypothetical protein VMR95_02020, partial [Candidatus Binatia bacterium]|nr:hypothetical protein [Candidatus Binatia bacterium]
LTADKTVIAGGNTYNLIGADWCQGSSCVPDPATENTLSGGNEVQVLTGASGEVVVYWEYESNSNVNYTTITGTIWNNTAGTADPYPNATVVAFCDNNEGVQTDCTGSQPANDSGGTINQTGPGGNWQLKLPQGVQYFIYVESPPPGAQTLQMDYDPTTNTSYAHPTTGSGLSVEYDPTIDSGTVTGNWDFYYKSSSGGGSQTVSITGRVYENGGTGIKDNGAYPDVVACDASGANCTDDPNNTDDGGNNHPGLTGPGGNWSLTLTVGGAYEIKVESGIDTITYPLLALAGGAYPEAGSGIGQYYTPRADSPTTTPSNGGWDFHYYNSGCNGIGCTGGGGTPTSCPTFPNYQSVNVPLAYAGENNPAPPTTSSQPADQATPAPIEQDTPVEVYYNSPSSSLPNGSITDISTGVKDQTPSHNPQYVSQNTAVNGGSVNLNYAPYATYYPYDTSLPQVNYYSVWNKIIWTPTLSGLSCPDGGTVSGTNCVYTQSANSSTSYSCPGGGTLGGTTCFTGAGKVVKGVCKGVSYNGGCYASSYGATANTSYSCPAGDGTVSGPDSNHVCTYTYTATANYNWTAGSPTQKYSTPADTTDGTLMPECYNRTLSLQPQTGSIGFDNYEDPTAINYNGSVVANYGVTVPVSTALGLRVPSSAKDISLSMTVTIQQLNGDTITNTYPLPNYANTVTPNPYSTSLTTSGSAPDITGNFTGQLTSLSETDTGSFGVAYQIPASDQIGGGGPNPFFQYGDRVCAVLSANPSGSQVDDTGTVALPTGPTAGAQTCSDPLAAQPYVQVFGGDVDSGVATKTPSDGTENCTVNSSAPVDTWNQATGEYDGSGTDLATIAAGDINGFASAQDNTGTFPPLSGSSPPDALSFANTLSNPPAVNLGGGQYGGDFGASSNDCINDYYSAGQPTAIASLGQDIGPSLLAALSSVPGSIPGGGLQVLGGTITIDDFPLADRWTDPNGVQYGIIPDKYNLTFYSSGPINIDTNILYPQPPSVITSGSGTPVIPANLPDLQIITLGDNVYGEADINIENTVTALAGTYISESGAINDCTLYSGSDPYVPNPIVPSDQWYYDPNNSTVPEDQTCDRQLTVYGSFVANNIGLDRTYGSLHEASNNATSSSTSSAAEVFDYTALNWLAYPPPNPATTKPPAVQAITSLPPVL